jgi:hypothetical protein
MNIANKVETVEGLQKGNLFSSTIGEDEDVTCIQFEIGNDIEKNIVLNKVDNVDESVNDCEQHEEMGFVINMEVNVMSRTWPGINKPGGAGKIVSFRYDEGNQHN